MNKSFQSLIAASLIATSLLSTSVSARDKIDTKELGNIRGSEGMLGFLSATGGLVSLGVSGRDYLAGSIIGAVFVSAGSVIMIDAISQGSHEVTTNSIESYKLTNSLARLYKNNDNLLDATLNDFLNQNIKINLGASAKEKNDVYVNLISTAKKNAQMAIENKQESILKSDVLKTSKNLGLDNVILNNHIDLLMEMVAYEVFIDKEAHTQK